MTKDELHQALDVAVPSGTKRRSNVRIIGHCLIELDLVTSVECGYEFCVMPTRAFSPVAEVGEYRGRGVATVDHVVSLSDGGTDLPRNLQLLHFACNAAKGGRDAAKNPEAQRKRTTAMERRWQDPVYREKMLAAGGGRPKKARA